jgi:hypothetical protein
MDSKWKWHNLIYKLIKELNIDEDKVYKKNYISTLNWLSFFYEKNKVEEAQLKQQTK